MRRWLTIALGGLVLSCQGPAAVMAREAAGHAATVEYGDRIGSEGDESGLNRVVRTAGAPRVNPEG